MNKIGRRDFLKFVGAGSVGTGAGILLAEKSKKTVELLVPQVVPPEEYTPGVATWYNTVCQQCSAGCGISVRTREGRAKKIEGNPVHPVNQGGLCALGQAGLNALYNPDRIRTPLKRDGARGAGKFSEITWDEALNTLAGRLGTLRLTKKASQVYLLSGGAPGHLDQLFATFMEKLGSPNYLHYDFNYPLNLHKANELSFGTQRLPYYDIKNTKYLLSFGADYLGTWLSPVHHSMSYGHLRQGVAGQRGKCVQVEPRMSLSGANADEWIVAKPGTEGLLALGIAHVIVSGGGYASADRSDWTRALESYPPATVARDTGVAEADIARIAKEFIEHRPSLAIGGGPVAAGTNAVASLAAINALNYLAGNLNVEGGIVFNPEPVIGSASPARAVSYARMVELAAALRNKAADVLLVHDCNPVFTLPAAAKFGDALAQVPFIAALSSFMDETTAMADLVLPTDTYLETWGDAVPNPGVGFPVASIAQPAVKRIYDTRSSGDIMLTLAHEVGGELPHALPWNDTEGFIKATWQALYQQKTQDTELAGFDDFWYAALEAGVWGENRADAAQGVAVAGTMILENIAVPPPAFDGDEGEYPFVFQPYLTQAYGDGRGANLPWMQELPDALTSVVYMTWVELNPQTAAQMGVREGDILEIESSQGVIRAPAVVYPAIRPDVVAMPIGQGHTHYGRYAQARGVNPLAIVAPQADQATGALAWAATRVKVTKTDEWVEVTKTDGVTRTLGRQILGDASEHA